MRLRRQAAMEGRIRISPPKNRSDRRGLQRLRRLGYTLVADAALIAGSPFLQMLGVVAAADEDEE